MRMAEISLSIVVTLVYIQVLKKDQAMVTGVSEEDMAQQSRSTGGA